MDSIYHLLSPCFCRHSPLSNPNQPDLSLSPSRQNSSQEGPQSPPSGVPTFFTPPAAHFRKLPRVDSIHFCLACVPTSTRSTQNLRDPSLLLIIHTTLPPTHHTPHVHHHQRTKHHPSSCLPRPLFRSPLRPSRPPPSLSTVSSRRLTSLTTRANGESSYLPTLTSSLRRLAKVNQRNTSHMLTLFPQGRPPVLPHGLHLRLPHRDPRLQRCPPQVREAQHHRPGRLHRQPLHTLGLA